MGLKAIQIPGISLLLVKVKSKWKQTTLIFETHCISSNAATAMRVEIVLFAKLSLLHPSDRPSPLTHHGLLYTFQMRRMWKKPEPGASAAAATPPPPAAASRRKNNINSGGIGSGGEKKDATTKMEANRQVVLCAPSAPPSPPTFHFEYRRQRLRNICGRRSASVCRKSFRLNAQKGP